MAMNAEFAHLFQLPIDERLQLVEDLWDSIAAESPTLDLTPAQCEELDRRNAELEAHPADGSTWEEVKARLLGPSP
jgi:putative addiction module component (TIGR02574 family)